MTNTWLLDFLSMSQECDLCFAHMPMIYLELYILHLQGNWGKNVIPSEANFDLVLEYSFKFFRKRIATLFVDMGCCSLIFPQKQSH